MHELLSRENTEVAAKAKGLWTSNAAAAFEQINANKKAGRASSQRYTDEQWKAWQSAGNRADRGYSSPSSAGSRGRSPGPTGDRRPSRATSTRPGADGVMETVCRQYARNGNCPNGTACKNGRHLNEASRERYTKSMTPPPARETQYRQRGTSGTVRDAPPTPRHANHPGRGRHASVPAGGRR